MFDYDGAERVIDTAKRKIEADLMIVFGSVARGTANDDSDLDILVVKDSDENSFIGGAEARLALYDSDIPIDIIVYTPEEFKEELSRKYSLAYEAVTTGKVVHGSMDYIG